MRTSGLLDTNLYDHPLFLANILALLDGEITNDEKEIIKDRFRTDKSVLEDIKAEIHKLDDLNPDYPMDKTIHVSKWAVIDIINKHMESEGT